MDYGEEIEHGFPKQSLGGRGGNHESLHAMRCYLAVSEASLYNPG